MGKQTIFTGSGVAMVTPMLPNGTINYAKLEELVDWHIEQGTDAIISCATTGEAPTLTSPEHLEALRVVITRAAGRIPVIAGTGSNDTAHCVEMCKVAQRMGADGLLLVTPYYNRTSQRGLIAHFTKVASAIDLPMILYNVPTRTAVNIEPETTAALYNSLEQIVGIKQSNGNIASSAKLASLCDIPLYSGNDDDIVAHLALGGKGVISVLANVAPQVTRDMCHAWFDGDIDTARRLQLDNMDLIGALFSDINPIPVKTAMNLMGMNVGECRLPLCPMEDTAHAKLAEVLRHHGLIK